MRKYNYTNPSLRLVIKDIKINVQQRPLTKAKFMRAEEIHNLLQIQRIITLKSVVQNLIDT
jgi:hypothetical protein